MKKLLVLASLLSFGFYGIAQAAPAELPLVGEYVNDAGIVVIAPAPKSQNANYDIGIIDKTGKCQIQIVAGTNNVSAQSQTENAPTFHPNTIAAVEGQKYNKFTMWPQDEKIVIAADALPFDQLDSSCQVFKNNLTFTRKN